VVLLKIILLKFLRKKEKGIREFWGFKVKHGWVCYVGDRLGWGKLCPIWGARRDGPFFFAFVNGPPVWFWGPLFGPHGVWFSCLSAFFSTPPMLFRGVSTELYTQTLGELTGREFFTHGGGEYLRGLRSYSTQPGRYHPTMSFKAPEE